MLKSTKERIEVFDIDCMYCTRNEKLQNMMIYICTIDGHALYLHRNQANPGRCILAYKEHIATIADISEEDAMTFFSAAYKVVAVLNKLFEPKQINLAVYGDLVSHVHFHFAPKFEGGQDFGKPFQINPEPPVYLTEEGYKETLSKIRDTFAGKREIDCSMN